MEKSELGDRPNADETISVGDLIGILASMTLENTVIPGLVSSQLSFGGGT